jgi:hypothetical protein
MDLMAAVLFTAAIACGFTAAHAQAHLRYEWVMAQSTLSVLCLILGIMWQFLLRLGY